jgi:S1-C subfamily serine protease
LASGTGFFINENGLILTCWHVIFPATKVKPDQVFKEITIETASGERIKYGIIEAFMTDTNLVKSTRAFDFFMLAPMDSLHRKFPFLKIGNFDNMAEGAEIYTCGYPLGIKQQFVSHGILSTKYFNKDNGIRYGNRLILMPRMEALMDITMNRGNSGEPVIKIGMNPDQDEVIGIADFIVTPAGGDIDNLINKLRDNAGVEMGGINTNELLADIMTIASSLSIGVSGLVSINHFSSIIRL